MIISRADFDFRRERAPVRDRDSEETQSRKPSAASNSTRAESGVVSDRCDASPRITGTPEIATALSSVLTSSA